LCSIDRAADGALAIREADDPPPRYAFLDVRACDLRGIAVHDRVLGGSAAYAADRLYVIKPLWNICGNEEVGCRFDHSRGCCVC
jgi:hypothetical protein